MLTLLTHCFLDRRDQVYVKYFLGIMKNPCLNNRLSHQEWQAMYRSFDTYTFFTKETLRDTRRHLNENIETCIKKTYQVNKLTKKSHNLAAINHFENLLRLKT